MKLLQMLCRMEAALPVNPYFWLAFGLLTGLALDNIAIGVALGVSFSVMREDARKRRMRNGNDVSSPEAIPGGAVDLQSALSLGQPAACQLYHFSTCPYCLRVRWAMKRRGIDVPLRNIHAQENYRDELLAGGGKQQVPCLRIVLDDGSVHWLYESTDIIHYLTTMLPARK